MEHTTIYIAADGTRFTSIVEYNRYNKKLEEEKEVEGRNSSTSFLLILYFSYKIKFDFLTNFYYNIIRKNGKGGSCI